MTIQQTLLSRGYLPKELPPAFFSEPFAKYARTKNGRATLSAFKPADGYTECTKYRLARPGGELRELKIPHPAVYWKLAALVAANFGRLLKKAGASKFSKSRPVYAANRYRALGTSFNPSNLARERMICRAGSAFLLKADISHFYPSLYTHAVGWAVDPKLRLKTNWKKNKLLGKKIDQTLMDLDGKISQGIPIGNDVSFLLAELVLSQIDKALGIDTDHGFRWFDDYEFAFGTRAEAETALRKLTDGLGQFRLRLNPVKTKILNLPKPADDDWQHTLHEGARNPFQRPREMVKYFDIAFRLREAATDTAIMSYALGMLFRLSSPEPTVGRVAQSAITQAILCEPGCAQKAFSLLSFWKLNGFHLDLELIARTVNQIVLNHRTIGVSSDVAWALAFCLDHKVPLPAETAKVLSSCEDDCVGLQALHLHRNGLLPKGFNAKAMTKMLASSHLDREHWLLAYESVRHRFLTGHEQSIREHPVFSELLAANVGFYRTNLPSYAVLIHPGGAPSWMIQRWVDELKVPTDEDRKRTRQPVVEMMGRDFQRLENKEGTRDEVVAELLDALDPTLGFGITADAYTS